ncbi:MAG: hypothetical protein AB2693_07730 [Candidatus Thiodiazotropha sp.]
MPHSCFDKPVFACANWSVGAIHGNRLTDFFPIGGPRFPGTELALPLWRRPWRPLSCYSDWIPHPMRRRWAKPKKADNRLK